VYVQWENAIKTQTTLKVLAIDNLHTIRKVMPPNTVTFEALKSFIEQYDIVLIKNTTFFTLNTYYSNHPTAFSAWARVMVDEAHDIIGKTPFVKFHFLWLISATYPALTHTAHGSRTNLLYAVRELFIHEYMNLILVKSVPEFVQQSFEVPDFVEHIYLCQLNRRLAAVQPFLTSSVLERVNANDIRGAIAELGGTSSTETDIVELVSKEIRKDIHNKEAEIHMYSTLMMDEDSRKQKIDSSRLELEKLKERLSSLIDRVTALDQKQCSICYDNMENPIMLDCTHVYCGKCIVGWMTTGNVCPTCRNPIRLKNLHAIVAQEDKQVCGPGPKEMQIKSKEDTVIDVIRSKPDGKFLIFSRIDAAFWGIMEKLRSNGISFVEMKGSTSHMMRTLDSFRTGQVQVILLSTYHAGSGIDISCATDVILLHRMGTDRQQAIGRAQRQGRTTQLHVHSLLYPHEDGVHHSS
jgi:hypothetical protein